MKNNEFLKRVLDHNKVVLENTLNAVTIAQEKGQQLAEQILEKATFIQKEVKEINQRWLSEVKEARENIKETLLKGHEQLTTIVTNE